MRTGTVYAVTHVYGTDGLFTRNELLEYCREWWRDVEDMMGAPDEMPTDPEHLVTTYFELHPEEYYDVFTVTEDMLDD